MTNSNVKPRVGFQKFNPFTLTKHRNKLIDHYRKFIEESGPYYFFITLTFKYKMPIAMMCKFVNYFLHVYNQKIFCWDYKDRNKFIGGFAFFEKHKSDKLRDRFHIHFLIKTHYKCHSKSLEEHLSKLQIAAHKVKNTKNNSVFMSIDLQAAGDWGRILYCTKEIWDKNLTDIKILGKDGLSDNY